jgi:hypothetical protein
VGGLKNAWFSESGWVSDNLELKISVGLDVFERRFIGNLSENEVTFLEFENSLFSDDFADDTLTRNGEVAASNKF